MTKRSITSLIMALVLVTSLTTGTIVSGAQQPPDLTKTYSWQPYGLSIAYPNGWTLTESDAIIRLRPVGRDVSDGFGPELVLFEQPDTTALQFETTIADLAASFGAESTITAQSSINGSTTIRAALTWTNPAASGEMLLIATEEQSALGAAYVVRSSESAEFHDALAAMFDSVALNVAAGVRSSASVTSVQLPQDYAWNDAGLVLHFPADWRISVESDGSIDALIGVPGDTTSTASIHATTIETHFETLDMSTITEFIAETYGEVLDSAEVRVAGYDGMAYDVVDILDDDSLKIRVVALKIVDRGMFAVLMLGAEESEWDAFRPTASAFVSSIEATSQSGAALSLVANTQPELPGGLPQQTDMQTFRWDDYGVSLNIPADWQSLGANQDYDLALVSPEAMTTGTGGFVIFNVYPSLGTDVTVENALQSTAEQAGSEITPFAPDGYGVTIVDESYGVEQNLILYPYNDHGAALFVQTSALTDDADLIAEILGTLTIAPPSVDYAAADAAFQASLKKDGTLTYGDENAPVAVTEFYSFTCGHCASYTLPIENFIALDVETGNARFELAPIAGDEKATRATHALYCAAEQGKGYSVYKALFNDYLINGYTVAFTEESVTAILARDEFGLDQDTLNTCLENEKYTPVINNMRLAFTDFGLTGTPTVVMGAHGDDIAPIAFPDGSIWSGTMQIGALRTIVSSVIEDGMSTQDAANLLFE